MNHPALNDLDFLMLTGMENDIHLTVTAPDGTYAATRAYYLSELLEGNE